MLYTAFLSKLAKQITSKILKRTENGLKTK